MKKSLFAALVLSGGVLPALADPDTAYQALRTVGTLRGNDVLKHVIEVQGREGVPQPVVWRVVLDDQTARGGVRELDVAHGKVISEHTPIRAYSGSAAGALIDFSKLNLDSSGAFAVAEKEAQKAKVGFDSVDYTLRTGDGPNANPIWVVQMVDRAHHSIGSLSLAADTGTLVSTNFSGGPAPVSGGPAPAPAYSDVGPSGPSTPPPVVPPPDAVPPPSVPDNDNVYNPANEPPPTRQADDSDTEDTHGLRIGHRIKHAFISAGETLKNFVTGDR